MFMVLHKKGDKNMTKEKRLGIFGFGEAVQLIIEGL